MKQTKESKRHLPKRSSHECPYSNSCFECPLDDCRAWSGNVATLNQLPEDMRNDNNR